jgi:major outer membrane protein
MKKLFTMIVTLSTCGAAYALPVGNPSDASLLCDGLIWEGHCGDPCDPCLTWFDAFSYRFGFYGDYVFNRHLQIDTNESDADIEHTRISTNAAFLAANFWDRFDLFAALGATHFSFDTNLSSFGSVAGPRIEIESDTHFSWGLGARGTIWECGCTSVGAEAQYFFSRPNISRVTVASLDSIYPTHVDMKYREWQVALGVSHRINVFVPYIAATWNRAKAYFDNATFLLFEESDLGVVTLFDMENKRSWGFAVGVSLADCEKTSLTIEGRFSNEKALYVNGQIRF